MKGRLIYENGRTGNMNSNLLDKLVKVANRVKSDKKENVLLDIINKVGSQKPATLRDVFAQIYDELQQNAETVDNETDILDSTSLSSESEQNKRCNKPRSFDHTSEIENKIISEIESKIQELKELINSNTEEENDLDLQGDSSDNYSEDINVEELPRYLDIDKTKTRSKPMPAPLDKTILS